MTTSREHDAIKACQSEHHQNLSSPQKKAQPKQSNNFVPHRNSKQIIDFHQKTTRKVT